MERFRQLGRALRNLARIAREQPIWAITALVTSPVALIRHLFGVVVLFLITGLVLGLGVPLILGKLLGLPRDSNIYQIVMMLTGLVIILRASRGRYASQRQARTFKEPQDGRYRRRARQRGGKGTRVSVRVKIGGRRDIEKKTKH